MKITFWGDLLRDFHHRLVKEFAKHLAGVMADFSNWDRPSVWKVSGDEVILTMNPGRLTCLKHYLWAFRKAVNACNKILSEKDEEIFHVGGETLRLRLKPRAWLVDFPLNNMELAVPFGKLDPERPDSPWEGESPDYAGKSIDTGFRLGALASSRKFVLSAEVVWALTQDKDIKQDFRLFYDGKVPLKGVQGGEPYPIFWLDLGSDELSSEDHWLGRDYISHADYKAVWLFCESFIGMDKDPFLRPYFEGEIIPSFIVEELNLMRER